jgi:hypothetical protein
MTRLIYPLELRDLIESSGDNVSDSGGYYPPFVRLIPKEQKITVGESTKVEVETAEGKTVESLPTSKTSKQYTVVKVPNVGVISEIILPMPPQIINSLSSNYQGVEGLGLIQNKGKLAYLKHVAVKKFLNPLGALPDAVVAAIKQNIFGGGIYNPHEKLLFAGHDRRSFGLSYDDLKPTSKEEEDQLDAIINTLEYCSIGRYGDWVVTGPPSFDVEFHSIPGHVILEFKNCKIVSFDNTMGGSGGDGIARMSSGFPISSIEVAFNEMDYRSADDIIITRKGK